jgi:N-acetylglutamate synthase-like GNAT family acetyltransferase
MSTLAVHPKYPRRGLGSQMLESILALANKEGRKAYIEASKKGVGLYRKYGWIKVDSVLLDTRPFGGKMIQETELMIRDSGTGKPIAASEQEIFPGVHQI